MTSAIEQHTQAVAYQSAPVKYNLTYEEHVKKLAATKKYQSEQKASQDAMISQQEAARELETRYMVDDMKSDVETVINHLMDNGRLYDILSASYQRIAEHIIKTGACNGETGINLLRDTILYIIASQDANVDMRLFENGEKEYNAFEDLAHNICTRHIGKIAQHYIALAKAASNEAIKYQKLVYGINDITSKEQTEDIIDMIDESAVALEMGIKPVEMYTDFKPSEINLKHQRNGCTSHVQHYYQYAFVVRKEAVEKLIKKINENSPNPIELTIRDSAHKKAFKRIISSTRLANGVPDTKVFGMLKLMLYSIIQRALDYHEVILRCSDCDTAEEIEESLSDNTIKKNETITAKCSPEKYKDIFTAFNNIASLQLESIDQDLIVCNLLVPSGHYDTFKPPYSINKGIQVFNAHCGLASLYDCPDGVTNTFDSPVESGYFSPKQRHDFHTKVTAEYMGKSMQQLLNTYNPGHYSTIGRLPRVLDKCFSTKNNDTKQFIEESHLAKGSEESLKRLANSFSEENIERITHQRFKTMKNKQMKNLYKMDIMPPSQIAKEAMAKYNQYKGNKSDEEIDIPSPILVK